MVEPLSEDSSVGCSFGLVGSLGSSWVGECRMADRGVGRRVVDTMAVDMMEADTRAAVVVGRVDLGAVGSMVCNCNRTITSI